MAEERRNKFTYDRNYYENMRKTPVEGSTARKYDAAEYEEDFFEDEEAFAEEYTERDFESTSPRRRRAAATRIYEAPEVRVKEKIERQYNFNKIFVLAMAVLLVSLVVASYNYIETRAEVIQANKRINSAQTELKDIQNINEALKRQLDVETDRNYIYTVAVSKLGMIYPKENNTVYYDNPAEGYVRQYTNIPTVR